MTDITYPLAMPSRPAYRTIGWNFRHADGMSESPFSFAQQVQLGMGEQWGPIEIQLPAMQRAEAMEWAAFMLSLRGRYGTFLLDVDPSLREPRGVISGSPVADSVGSPSVNTARSTKLYLRDCPTEGSPSAGVANIFRKGDMIGLDDGFKTRLHMNLTDVSSDASGRAVLNIWPFLRRDVPDGTAIAYRSCQGTFRLLPGRGWDVGEAQIYSTSLLALEALGD
jgi:hypothetical protein